MKELSFFRGLFIGGLFSLLFWAGAAYTITSTLNDDAHPTEILNPEIEDSPVALL